MATIQEALRELNSQSKKKRKVVESKRVSTEEQPLKEETALDRLKKLKAKFDSQKKNSTTEELVEDEKEVNEGIADFFAAPDEDGDIEDLSFSLSKFVTEGCNLNEGTFKTDAVKADPRFKDVPDMVIRQLVRAMEKDQYGNEAVTAESFLDWVDAACSGGALTPIALEQMSELPITSFFALVKADPKFEEVTKTIAERLNWIDKNGFYIEREGAEGTRKPAKYEDLVRDLFEYTDSETKDELETALTNAYFDNDFSYFTLNESLNEDLKSSFPVTALPEQEVVDYINNIPVARGIEKAEDGTIIAKARPTCFFKLGYFKEIQVAAKYRGGRGSTPDDPIVRVFKAVEYNKLYTGADYENLKGVKQFRKETGTERAGERTGFSYQGEGTTVNKIGTYSNGDKALQAYLANNCKTKTKYFISLNDEDLREASREEVAQYLTPGEANKLLNPQARPKTVEKSTDAESGEEIVVFNPQAVNRLKIANIYMIGNLGHSIV